MIDLNTLCYISEDAPDPDSIKGKFDYEEVKEDGRTYVKFLSALQSFGVMNRNNRSYNGANIMECINTDPILIDYLNRNAWIGECDHPSLPTNGAELSVQRISFPDQDRSSHFIRKPWLEGNLLMANLQTDTGTKYGNNLAFKIIDAKLIPAFSARVFGELKHHGSKPEVHVKRLITYDWVQFPSHAEAVAKFHQPLQESVGIKEIEKQTGLTIIFFDELARAAANCCKETTVLCESLGVDIDSVVGLTDSGNSVVIAEKQNVYIRPISDQIIQKRTKNALNDWLNS